MCFYMQNCSEGSVLLGTVSYGKLNEGKDSQKNPASYQISYMVPPTKVNNCVIHGTIPLQTRVLSSLILNLVSCIISVAA